MSPRTDQYLSICLSEASKSPLHYRHGCIIVAGGKVIGKGFNHYRPGFSSGAFKTGQLSKASAFTTAMASTKQKKKQKFKQQQFRLEENESTCTFTPSEMPALMACTAGNAADVSRMALWVVLMLDAWKNRASNFRVVLNERTNYGSMSRLSVKSRSLRAEIAQPQHAVASGRFKSRVLKPLHINSVKEKNGNCNNGDKKNGNENENENVEKNEKHTSTSRYKTMKSQTITKHSSPVLLPYRSAGSRARKTAERQQDPRLRGADLYVARLCGNNQSMASNTVTPSCCDGKDPEHTPNPNPSTGSLHEELRLPNLTSTQRQLPESNHRSISATASRPCYRCLSYMHSVGIKRVFWTNEQGEWDGAKVRDLVDSLESANGMETETKDSSAGGASGEAPASALFVTKHEVLMLRRMMGS
ncbi:MAG: hypothetical protein MMC33_000550 [Icmadophila ericetorum]|nr:hypothetical protein [Icmadophila ericetorum]